MCHGAAPDRVQGFVPGDSRPSGNGHAIRVEGGWMVAYDETIPGTDVTFRMIPVSGGTFTMGSDDKEEGRNTDEGPSFKVTIDPFWMGQNEALDARPSETFAKAYTQLVEQLRPFAHRLILVTPVPFEDPLDLGVDLEARNDRLAQHAKMIRDVLCRAEETWP